MAAFTEGFDNVSGGAGKGPQHLGKVIGLILEARQLASSERREAQKKLSEQAPHLSLEDFGIDKGYFFKKALQHNFGGEFIDQKKQSLKTLLSARRILKSKKKIYVTTRNFLRDNIKVDGGRAASFRKKFDYKLEVETPAGLEDSSKKVAKAASGGGGRPKTKQDFLTAVTEIAKSLQSTAQSINNAVDQNTGIASGIVSTQKNIVVEISHRTDRVTDKLEAIAAAVNQQTEFLKRAKATAKADKTEEKGELKRLNASFTRSFDNSGTRDDESMQMSTSEETVANRSRTDITPKDPWDMEKGGVIEIDGPDTGYKATTHAGVPFTAHGKELMVPTPTGGTQIIPVDNRATDGISGNEVTPGGDLMAEKGMKIPPMPDIPDFKSLTPLAGLDLSKPFKQASNITTTSSSSASGQDLLDAMQLPFRAVGASLLKITGEVRNKIGGVSPTADGKLDNITNVITNSFGLTSQDVAPTKASSEANARVKESDKNQKEIVKDDRKWYDGIKNFIGAMTEKTTEIINSAGDNINKAKDWGRGLINRFLGNGDQAKSIEFSKKDIAAMLFDEFKKQGFSESGARLAVAELMRETGLDQGLILGSHDDGGVEAFGAGSWQGGREDGLFAHLESLGIKREDIANSGEKGIRGNASFLVEEIASRGGGNAELLALLRKPNLSTEEQDRVRKLFKDAYFVYHQDIPLSRSEDSLRYIMELLGVQLDTSNLQSLSTKDAFTSNSSLLEDLNLGSIELMPEIAHINLGAVGNSFNNTSYTDTLNTGDDTLSRGPDWMLEMASYYPQNLHV